MSRRDQQSRKHRNGAVQIVCQNVSLQSQPEAFLGIDDKKKETFDALLRFDETTTSRFFFGFFFRAEVDLKLHN